MMAPRPGHQAHSEPSLLPHLCSGGTRNFLYSILRGVSRGKERRNLKLDNARAIFQHVLDNGTKKLVLRPADFEADSPPAPMSAFITLLQQGLRLGLVAPVCSVLDSCAGEFLDAQLSDEAKSGVTEFLGLLVNKSRNHLSNLEAPAKATLNSFFETVLRHGLLCDMPSYPEGPCEVSNFFTLGGALGPCFFLSCFPFSTSLSS